MKKKGKDISKQPVFVELLGGGSSDVNLQKFILQSLTDKNKYDIRNEKSCSSIESVAIGAIKF
jgi:hypothetical protein